MSGADGLGSLAAWPGAHRAAGWCTDDGQTTTAGEPDLPLNLASVTKLFTAVAVLLATEEEVLALDEPAGPPGSTVRLLLCHASGLPFKGTTTLAEPGRRRIYGNTAYEVLGSLWAERTGVPLAEYVREGVLEPLDMRATAMGERASYGARSTVTVLLRFAGELLHPGRVLAPATLAEAVTPQLPDLRGVLPGFGRHNPNPWGLGFEIHGHKTPHWMPPDASPATFGHFGQSGSFVWVDPEAGVACAGLSDEPYGDRAKQARPALGRAVLRAAAG